MNKPTPNTVAQIENVKAEIALEQARFDEMHTVYAMVKQRARIKELHAQLELLEKATQDYGTL